MNLSTPETWRNIESRLGMTDKNQNGFIFRKRGDRIVEEFVFQVEGEEYFGVYVLADKKVRWWTDYFPEEFNLEETVDLMIRENKPPEKLPDTVLSQISPVPISSKKTKTVEHKGWYLQAARYGSIWNVSKNFAWGVGRLDKRLWFARVGDLVDLTWYSEEKIPYSLEATLEWFRVNGYSILHGANQ